LTNAPCGLRIWRCCHLEIFDLDQSRIFPSADHEGRLECLRSARLFEIVYSVLYITTEKSLSNFCFATGACSIRRIRREVGKTMLDVAMVALVVAAFAGAAA
jgi:hypothetical protein